MSRNFNGGMPPSTDGKKTKPSDAIKEAMIRAKAFGAPKGGGRYGSKPDYQEQMQNRIEEYKAEMLKEAGSSRKVALPGTDPDQDQGLSENAKKGRTNDG